MKDYRKLVVWERAHKLVLFVYKITRAFPKEEQYNLVSQIRRAAISTPTNIAEGCGAHSQPDFARYLQNAFGSMQEVQYLSFLSFELSYLDQEAYTVLEREVSEVKAMLNGLIRKVREKR
jgi:four helix bundle protein